ncbi:MULTISPECIES: hypothetical protein [Streptomyces]|uniref:hypothetical protein n=1 Tax=Streptomyces TaxID=1883 RepID=UPI0004CC9AEE|nr:MULTISPECIES: hypothetical protein [Streptomyces]KOT52693.1 hypothetical protein ADK43_29970 [Streptomyces rimosus subsp. rimosus]
MTFHPAPDDVSTALAALHEALEAAGAAPRAARTRSTDLRTTFLLHNAALTCLPNLPSLPTDAAGAALVQALAEHRIPADVTIDAQETDTDLTLATFWVHNAAAAHQLADFVLGHLPEPYAAALHLRRAVRAAGAVQLSVSVRKDHLSADRTGCSAPVPCVELGEISARNAFHLLLNALADDPQEYPFDWDNWEILPPMALLFTEAVAQATGVGLDVTPVPGCRNCRENSFDLGLLTPDATRTLADALQAAAG